MEERTKIDRHNEHLNQIAGLADESLNFNHYLNFKDRTDEGDNILGGCTNIYSGGKRNSKATKFSKMWKNSIAEADRLQVFAEDSIGASKFPNFSIQNKGGDNELSDDQILKISPQPRDLSPSKLPKLLKDTESAALARPRNKRKTVAFREDQPDEFFSKTTFKASESRLISPEQEEETKGQY